VLSGAAPDALSGRFEDFAAALAHEDALQERIETHGVQTNEVQRLHDAVADVSRGGDRDRVALELIELGPSAGLNLLVDRYRYRYANGSFGSAEAQLELTVGRARWTRSVGAPRARARRPSSSGESTSHRSTRRPRTGTSCCGALSGRGSTSAVARLDAAVETLRQMPERPELIGGDYTTVLPRLLADRPADALTVVFETFSTIYLPDAAAQQLVEALETAGADGRPLAWVSVRRWDLGAGKDAAFELELRVWPGAARVAAHVDPHGNTLDWRL
jgi:hypothetical protein